MPVLSSKTTSDFPAFSRAVAFLNNIPFPAPIPLPTIIATGVASPSAHGQLITRTEIALESEKPIGYPTNIHIKYVITAIAITIGTKTPETLSASFAIGAFDAAASLTIFIIRERVVSSPTLTASQVTNPVRLIVAVLSSSPASLSTGILSPVSALSSTLVVSLMILPSTAILSPGLTTKISPGFTSSEGTVTSMPSRTTVAVSGASFIRLFMASVVFPLE